MPAETEVLEFKEAKNNYDFKELGKYFSALNNEANLKNKPYAWLIFGVNNQKKVVGTQYRANRKDLDHLKYEIAEKINNRLTFIEIHELQTAEGRVILFQIPPAPLGIPTAFGGFFFGRDGESAGPLNIEEIERIRRQIIISDWSIGICQGASIDDLDNEAIAKARANYKIKNPRIAQEVDDWDTAKFLNKAKLSINGGITNSCILLLGKPESEHFLAPAIARITWVLKNTNNEEKDYEHFSCPFLLAIDKVFAKIRNLKYRYIKDGTLFPEEIERYDPFNIKEALSNCIAHQDYTLSSRISVVEVEDEQLIFTNAGEFLPGSIESVLDSDQPPLLYRNSFLVQAMVNLNMIDTIGSGIKRMFRSQRERFFPMPDYDLSGSKVKAVITGKVLDMEYARVLARHPDLSLDEIIILDKVQKKKELSENEIIKLKVRKLIEGRKPNFIISEQLAVKTKQVGSYLKTRGFDKQYYKKLVLEFINKNKYGSAKSEIRELLWKKLPELLTDTQKETKISNILRELRQENKIVNTGNDAKPNWISIK
ncbi:MAG: transcriptional regulator [Ignavibacteria bacterium]|nr:transcriptional regulator [Ignavibacteria bacterium]